MSSDLAGLFYFMARRAIPKTERHIIYRKCDGRCCYCGNRINFKDMQVDHYFPYSLKTHYEKNTTILVEDSVNLMPSCRSCNHYKRGDSLKEFKHKMCTIHNRLYNMYIYKVAVNFGIINTTPFDGLFWFEKNREFGVIYPDDIYNI